MSLNKSVLSFQRLNSSPYLGNDFLDEEANAIKEQCGVLKSKLNSAIILTNTHTDPRTIDLNSAQLIIHANSGYDNFSFEWAKQCSTPIILGNQIRSQAVANSIIARIFEHLTRHPRHLQWDKDRNWDRELLIHKNILILGAGHIGKILLHSLTPLCKKVEVYDPYLGHNTLNHQDQDIIIPVMSLNPSSYHFIDANFLQLLSKPFILINSSRGEIIDETALFAALATDKLNFAYLDVFEQEPFDIKALEQIPNCIATSHIAGVYQQIATDIIKFEVDVINDFINLTRPNFMQQYQSVLLQSRMTTDFII